MKRIPWPHQTKTAGEAHYRLRSLVTYCVDHWDECKRGPDSCSPIGADDLECIEALLDYAEAEERKSIKPTNVPFGDGTLPGGWHGQQCQCWRCNKVNGRPYGDPTGDIVDAGRNAEESL